MKQILTLCIVSALLFAGEAAAQYPGYPGQLPFRIDMQFQWNIRLLTPQQYMGGMTAPWYAYFPYDSQAQIPTVGNRFPNWPQPFPKDGAEADQKGTKTTPSGASNTLQSIRHTTARMPAYWQQP